MTIWTSIYRLTDGVFLRGGVGGVQVDAPATEGRVDLDLDVEGLLDMALERYDASAPTKRRPATPAERAAWSLTRADAQAALSAVEKNLAATCAAMLEKFDPTWPGMTTPQKKAAVQALAVRWLFWRQWAERNL